jgi:hypothetical protein
MVAAIIGLLAVIALTCAGIWLVGYAIVGPFLGG